MAREDLDLRDNDGTRVTLAERVREELYGHPKLVQEVLLKGAQSQYCGKNLIPTSAL